MRANREENRESTSMNTATRPVSNVWPRARYHTRLAATSGVAVVLFSAPHCGACRAWKQLLPQCAGGPGRCVL